MILLRGLFDTSLQKQNTFLLLVIKRRAHCTKSNYIYLNIALLFWWSFRYFAVSWRRTPSSQSPVVPGRWPSVSESDSRCKRSPGNAVRPDVAHRNLHLQSRWLPKSLWIVSLSILKVCYLLSHSKPSQPFYFQPNYFSYKLNKSSVSLQLKYLNVILNLYQSNSQTFLACGP
jgi:hypothetical protein